MKGCISNPNFEDDGSVHVSGEGDSGRVSVLPARHWTAPTTRESIAYLCLLASRAIVCLCV